MKVQPVVSLENSTNHRKQENVRAAMSESVSTEKAHLLTELNYDSNAKMSEMEDLDVSNCKDELLYSLDRSIDDLELKSKLMEDLDAAVLEHNDLVGDLACHSQEIEEFDEPVVETVSTEALYDERAVETVSAEELYDEPVVETVSAEEQYDEAAVEMMVVPVPEVAQAKMYV